MENNIDEDIKEKIILLKDFIEGNFERDKLENYKGSYKMGYFYYSDIKQAIEKVLSELKRSKENEKIAIDNLECLSETVVMLTEPLGLEEDALIEEMYDKIRALNRELETYKKIAEKLAHLSDDICSYIEVEEGKCASGECVDCIIDWARKEVENEKRKSI